MAAYPTQPVIADTPSQEVELMRVQLNNLMNYVNALQAAVAASTAYADLKTGIAAVDVTKLALIVPTKKIPPARRFPTHA